MKRVILFCGVLFAACEIVDNDMEKHVKPSVLVSLEEMAEVMAHVPFSDEQMGEVYDAVSSSASNGYDEEYTMKNLFASPGAGVGDEHMQSRSSGEYEVPFRELIEKYIRSAVPVKSGPASPDAEEWLKFLTESDMQIYWPFSENWDGKSYPVITYDPEDNSQRNIGYRILVHDDGSRSVEEVLVDEEMARNNPVWVVNRNSDAGYKTLEILRREDPDWGNGGGSIIVKPSETKRSKSGLKTLMLKDFTMNRNYDSWFAGASEFFVLTITGGCSFA